MRRFAFVVSYDGRGFQGWQSQIRGNAVQDRVEEAFCRLTQEDVRVTGSGRTDTGVSAAGQVFHCDLSGEKWTPEVLLRGLNHYLPPTVRVVRAAPVAPDFHARHDVVRKIYRYRWVPLSARGRGVLPTDSPFCGTFVEFPDWSILQQATKLLEGSNDFSHFTIRKSCPENARRTIDAIRWVAGAGTLDLWVAGRGFLHMMIRYIAMALLETGQKKRSVESLRNLLHDKSPPPVPPLQPAAPEGLSLIRVLYGKKEPFPPGIPVPPG
ncbi:MAG: tRNA pseudouridine(38-40) synthase TruA [Nitrospirae bacterium]|jgi:tRNA pseudouridine38-40 synthase|nr:tRNA pseudouridine(38-40) synthase TruA [Nitrospirota bacterium]